MRCQVAPEMPNGSPWSRSTGRSRRLLWLGVGIVATVATACGSSPSSTTPPLSKAARSNPTCALVTVAEASKVLGHGALELPSHSEPADESACTWHTASSGGHRSFDVFLNDSSAAVQSFMANLSHPQSPVVKTTVSGTAALFRPASDASGGTAYVSAAADGALVSVEAAGGTPSVNDSSAKSIIVLALTKLRANGGT
jgi:hypothetical protein